MNMAKMNNEHKANILLFYLVTMTTNILIWNVRGIMSSSVALSNILDSKRMDIAIISEHRLLPSSVSFLESINSRYTYYAMCSEPKLLNGNQYMVGLVLPC